MKKNVRLKESDMKRIVMESILEDTYDKVFKRLKSEGVVGIVWSIVANSPFDEDKFKSFKYGFQLSDNEDALAKGLPHRHNLTDICRSMGNMMDNEFVELGRQAYETYGDADEMLCAPHCSTCRYYEVIERQMYCCHHKKRITARKKACNKYTSYNIHRYLNIFYNGKSNENQSGS